MVVMADCGSSSGSGGSASKFTDGLRSACRTASSAASDLDASDASGYLHGARSIVSKEIDTTGALKAPKDQQAAFDDFSSNLDDQLSAFRKVAAVNGSGNQVAIGKAVTRLVKVVAAGDDLATSVGATRCVSIFDGMDLASLGAASGTTTDTGPTSTNVAGVDGSSVTWGPCTGETAPWVCGAISVPLDYTKPSGDHISIALNRLPAAVPAERIGAIVLNPGGPGGSGLDAAYGNAPGFPQDLLDRFDIVGFDPRGIGKSAPVSCDGKDLFADPSILTTCVATSGAELSYLGTTNVARDLDQIRVALGEKKLTYLGFSYGTAIGSVYADMFPQNVRAIVLDGSIDPAAGEANTAADPGGRTYTAQDFDGTTNIFLHLCDSTPTCPAGPDSTRVLNSVLRDVGSLPTNYFKGATKLTTDDIRQLLTTSMYSIEYWPLLASALGDAKQGDASTFAALISYLAFGYPANMSARPESNYTQIAVTCADFAERDAGFFCHPFPPTQEPIPAIATAKGAPPMVIIGTKGDPATPYQNSAKMATALGNSVSLTWEGAGHTAFFESACISDLVTAYFVKLTEPPANVDCPFLPGATTDKQLGDRIFGHTAMMSEAAQIEQILESKGDDPAIARCVSTKLAANGDHRLVVHELLGVDSPDLVQLRTSIEASCKAGG